MNENTIPQEIAEKYLDEMLEADEAGNYQGFIKRFNQDNLEGFTEADFLKDIEDMREELGSYQKREFLGSLNGLVHKIDQKNLRFVWRAYYEKNEALIIVGIYQENDQWYVNESIVSH